MPDRVRASHILIPYKGAQSASGSIKRSKKKALAFITDLHAKATGADDFAALAKEHSS